jgi:serine/threonine protein kinase
MSIRTNPCDGVNLAVLLNGDENSDLFRRAANHVESCPECQRRLTELSGDADHWAAQREMLRPVVGDHPESKLLCRYHSPEFATWKCHAVDESTVKELLVAPSHPEMLGRLGRYEIERIVGTGGMGIVLKGFDSELNRPVAIKLLAPYLARVGAARQRFAREARAAAAVVHEHVVPIHNVESDQAIPFLVMQFIAGESLQARVDRDGPLSVPEILRIGMQAASGLAAAHAQGLVHRDVKPANILLENSVERVYLTDFGLARASDDASLTYTGVVAGTPHYMSPEQADGQPLDHRSDLFSLGSVLYFMATGHPPFRAARPMAVLKRTCHDPHRPAWQCNAEIPVALSEIIDRLLEKKPGSRFASAAELGKALASVLADVQQGRIGPRQRSRCRRHYWAVGLGLFAISAVVVAVSPFVVPLASNGNKDDVEVSPARAQATDSAEDEQQPAIVELDAVDPSPASTAHSELGFLSGMLDLLEAIPFPETEFGTLQSTDGPSRESDPKSGGTTPAEDESPTTDQSAAWPMNFHGAPWKDVLDWYAAIAGSPLQADEFPDGTFNYADSAQHSVEDAANILQPVLRIKGMLLKRQPRGIQLLRLKGTENGSILLPIGLASQDDLAERRKAFEEFMDRDADLNKQRDAVPDDAADREMQVAIIKARTEALQAEFHKPLRANSY